MSSKFSLILKSSGFRVLQTFVGIIIGLLMMPFLIRTLGQELYGIWVVIGSIVGAYYLLDLGFNQAVTRYVTKFIHQNRIADANRVINNALLIYAVLGVVVFFISFLAAKFGASALMKDIRNLTLAQTVLIISGLTLAMEFPAKAFPGVISAYMRFDFIAKVRLIKSIVDAGLIYLFLSNGYGIITLAIINLVTGTISTLIFLRYTSRLFKELEFGKKYLDLVMFKDVFHFSKWVFFIDTNSLLRDKMDIWFIAYYLGNVVLTTYYVAVRLVDYALQFLTQATGMTGPLFTEYHAKGENQKLRQVLMLFVKIDMALACLVLSGFYLLGIGFIDIWMQGAVDSTSVFASLIILALGRFSVYVSSPFGSLLLTLNKHYLMAYLSIIEMLCGVILCVFLVPIWGMPGAALGIAIPNLIGRMVILPLLVCRHFDFAIVRLALRLVAFFIASALCSYILGRWIISSNLTLMSLLGWGIIVALYQPLLSPLLFDRDDYSVLMQKLKYLAGRAGLSRFKNV